MEVGYTSTYVCKSICMVEDPWKSKFEVIGILRFQIEIERMLSLVGVLTALRHYCLQVQNLDRMITIINNWRDDSHLNCILYVNLKDYLKAEICLANELIKEVEYFKELQVDEDKVIHLNPKPKRNIFLLFLSN